MNASRDELQSVRQQVEQLQEALKRRERQSCALRRISEGLSLVGGETLISQAMDVALTAVGAHAGAVLLYEAPDDALVFRCVLGPRAEFLTGVKIPASQGVAGQVLRTGLRDIARNPAQQEGFHLSGCDESQREASESETLLTVPLRRSADDTIGVVQVLWARPSAQEEAFDEGDLEVVRVFCAGVVAALETARLSRQAHRAEIVSIIGDISHDIKNMLTPIQSGLWTLEPLLDQLFEELETLREQSKGRAAQGQIARIIELVQGNYGWILQSAHASCDQVTARTREIADAVKGELAPPVFQLVDLNDIVGEIARALFVVAEQTNVHLHFDLDHDLPLAELDRKQIYNALYNLVNNALPETPSGGSVTIRTKAPAPGEEALWLEVEDTGNGVPEHIRSLLFSDQAVSTKAGGTGLGTRIVGGVVRRHQGSISVQSEMGRGSTFSIRLPLRHGRGDQPSTAPPGSLPARRHNLPVPATSFVGRDTERKRAREMLQDGARLLTLSGAAGTGKTRLALQVAADLVDEFPDGAWLVSLAPIENADRVVAAIAATLGVREEPGRDLESSLVDFLRSKRLLLLLDNFEQVFAAAPLVAALLRECEGLKILVTSRSLLHLRGERELPVAPLEVPAMASFPARPSAGWMRELALCDSVALFVERATQVRPDFEISVENARDVALICARLDGLPLAIELAAARVKILSPSAIYTHLENHLPLPGNGPQDAPRRHQTLRAALDWSYDLLAPAEQKLLRRLMVFEGGCAPEAARVVAATDELELDAWSGLEMLCDKSLLRHGEQNDGSTWFFALETLRQYGREKLVQNGELEAMRKRHAAYYLMVAEAAHALLVKEPGAPPPPPGLPSSEASQTLWREWREREHQNLRAALNWFLDHAGDEVESEPPHGALRMALALRQLWIGDLWTERREALERALENSPHAPGDLRLMAMLFAGDLAVLQSDMARAGKFGGQSLALSQQLENGWAQARALGILANVALESGDLDRARTLHEQSLLIHRDLGNVHSVPWVLYFLGTVAKRAGDEEGKRDYFSQSLAGFREIDDKEGIASALYQLGMALYQCGDSPAARAMLEESLAIFTDLTHQTGVAWTRGFLGKMAADAGNLDLAREQMEQSLEISRRLGSRSDVRSMLQSLGEIALLQGNPDRAREILRELIDVRGTPDSNATREALKGFVRLAAAQGQNERAARLSGTLEPDALQDLEIVAVVREALGKTAFEEARQRGAALTPEEITREALQV